jgi:hypothetical protein
MNTEVIIHDVVAPTPTSSLTLRPHALWRVALWTCVGAWLAAIIVIVVSVVFAFGFGFISMFAGSLGGFHTFWLGETNYGLLFFTPLAGFVVLYALRPFIRRFAAAATGGERTAAAFAGIAMGMLLTCVVAGGMWTVANERYQAAEKAKYTKAQ